VWVLLCGLLQNAVLSTIAYSTSPLKIERGYVLKSIKVKDCFMPLLIPKSPSPGPTGETLYNATTKSNSEWKSKTSRIANQWTSDERSERRRQSVVKRKWLFHLIINASLEKE
jgi:hypothetical protein